ncbi:hypothetical protein [Ethanoligenens sp.]|uniref:hypothetical protein n=1 Tax=Ethanoligenens sp. TaxID=2099655 RepID=UPI0039E973DE
MSRKPKEYVPRRVVEHHPENVTEEEFMRGAAEVQAILRRDYERSLAQQAESKKQS